MNQYTPIPCSIHSVYENACLRLQRVTVEFQGVIQDISPITTETTKEGEFLTFLNSTRTRVITRLDNLRLITKETSLMDDQRDYDTITHNI